MESSDVHAGGTEAVGGGESGANSKGGGWLGRLRGMATSHESDPLFQNQNFTKLWRITTRFGIDKEKKIV